VVTVVVLLIAPSPVRPALPYVLSPSKGRRKRPFA